MSMEDFKEEIKNMTDRELAQARRSRLTGADALYEIVLEQYKRDLLRRPRGADDWDDGDPRKGICTVVGYWPEKKKRIKDYRVGKKTSRIYL